jgi:DNA-binding NarL/FixJ family response regulator
MSARSRIRLLVVEDHFLVRVGLISATEIEPDLQVVGEASSGPQAIQLFRELRPDVVIMDLRLPGMSGIEATRTLTREFPGAVVLVLTSHAGDEDIYRALQAGARGYVLKEMPREKLLEAIRAVHAGRRFIPPEVATRLAERMPQSELTPRELEVLRLLAQGLHNREIGQALAIAEGTVKVHVINILGKLGAADRTQAATMAMRRGIIHLE